MLALLVIREVLAFLAKRKNGNGHSSGEQPLSYWQQEFRLAVKDSIREDMNRLEAKIDRLLEARR